MPRRSQTLIDTIFNFIPQTDLDDLRGLFVWPSYPPGTDAHLDDLYYRKFDVKHGVLSDIGLHLIMWLAVKEARLVWGNPMLHDLVPLREYVSSNAFVLKLGMASGWTFQGQTNQRKRILATFGSNLVEEVPRRLKQRQAFRKIIRAILPEIRRSLVTPRAYSQSNNISQPTRAAPFPTLEVALKSCDDAEFRTLMPHMVNYLRNNELPKLPALSPELENVVRRRRSASYESLEQEGDIFLYKLVDTALMDFDLGWEVNEFRIINRFLSSNIFQAHLLHYLGPSYRDIIPLLPLKSLPWTVLKAMGDSIEVWYGALGCGEDENEDKLNRFADELFLPIIRFLRSVIQSGALKTRNTSSSSSGSIPVHTSAQPQVKRTIEQVEPHSELPVRYKKPRSGENTSSHISPKKQDPKSVQAIVMNSVENLK